MATDVVHRSVARYGIAGNGTRLSLSTGWTKGADSKLDLLRTMTVSAQSEELIPAALPLLYPVYGEVLAFDQLVDGLIRGRPLAVTGVRQAISLKHPAPSPFKGHKVPWGGPQPPPALILDDGGSSVTTAGRCTSHDGLSVHRGWLVGCSADAGGLRASLAQVPSPLLRLDADGSGRPGRVLGYQRKGDIELVASDSATETMSEIVSSSTRRSGPASPRIATYRPLQLATALVNVYERATVRINANVAAHPRRKREGALGQRRRPPYQQFILRQPPLTYVERRYADRFSLDVEGVRQ